MSLGALSGNATAREEQTYGIDYLEALGQPGALNPKVAFIAPSAIDDAYSHAIYVNAATSGGGAQKMWVLERENGSRWRVALHDPDFWATKGLPEGTDAPYSWPVSTGRHYPGERRAGPTPLGIFNVDERNYRHRRGWGSPGMYNSIYIDLHYSSGRISGVAMHGTTNRMYSRLGRADSHGCVRMTKANSERVWQLFHPEDARGAQSPLWGSVPRYFSSVPRGGYETRRGYVRDGSFLTNASGEDRLMKDGYTALFVFFRDDI
ncbi:hypothetical protein JANAI62_08130 [Jannaschia pagri]|uniref:L,D-TPase catalytic domain-containing protein n=1 Tax=Jannaschia pagri TaxID=2829797 RepID=A0ABQ4NID4_9RHOB|nr:hypothetical protein JANAI62_08130 [Jannaschia sp. AI_62]